MSLGSLEVKGDWEGGLPLLEEDAEGVEDLLTELRKNGEIPGTWIGGVTPTTSRPPLLLLPIPPIQWGVKYCELIAFTWISDFSKWVEYFYIFFYFHKVGSGLKN